MCRSLRVDRLRDLARLWIDDEQLVIEIAGDVDRAVGSDLNPVRRAIRASVDRASHFGRVHVDDGDFMARIRIAVPKMPSP